MINYAKPRAITSAPPLPLPSRERAGVRGLRRNEAQRHQKLVIARTAPVQIVNLQNSMRQFRLIDLLARCRRWVANFIIDRETDWRRAVVAQARLECIQRIHQEM